VSACAKPPAPELAERLAYILYQAWCEARFYAHDAQRIFDLADAIHNLPALLVNCTEGWLTAQREDLVRYCAKYPSARDYVRYMDGEIPEHSQWLWLWEESSSSSQLLPP
jgi:hypothetical protein